MSGGIFHNNKYFVACCGFEFQGERIVQNNEYICIVFGVRGPAMTSSPYRGPITIGQSFIIPEEEGSPNPARFYSLKEALENGIAMCDRNSW
jgi:hypothetical protein